MKKKMFLGAEKLLFQRAAQLRENQTFAEETLWNYLRAKPLGFKFRRPHPFFNYILDFYCHSLKLVIEVDGSIHDLEEIKKNDELSQKQLQQEGLTFLRFRNDEIKVNPQEVIKKIEAFLMNRLKQKGTL